jgi:asparagine synthase (glutamine-hydrolysing)
MCGIAGIVRPRAGPAPDQQALLRMAGAIGHRGPDGFGYALDRGAGLVNTRLSIFDLPGGWQPIQDGPGGSIIVYNGEVYWTARGRPPWTGSTDSSRSPGGSPARGA